MSSSIPTSTSIVESAVIDAPLSAVWHLIKIQSFGEWWSLVKKVEDVPDASSEAAIVKVTFKDGSVVDYKQEEHSSIHHYITYSIVAAEPALSFSSVYSTIRVYAVSSGAHENKTFVEWSATFSGDADAAAIQDGRYKRKEALSDLAAKAAAK